VRARGGRSVTAWLQRDLASARDMQRMFLPRPMETNSAHVRVLAEYLPAFAVGGDFYDFVDLGAGRLLATIGDVSGKGVSAALMMSRVTSELRRLAYETSGPAEILTRLNRSLRGMQDDRFVTVVCVLLDVPNRRWVVANGGHVVPLLRRRGGVVSGLAYSLNPPIGMIPMPEYRDEVFPLESQDIVLLATDGVLEMLAGGPRDVCSTMGQCQLVDMLRKAPHDLAEIHRRILSSGDSTTNGRDDVALLGLQLTE
jgi:sigma-B regulation protein RsbU (phosphoserine phosphatase)